MKRFVKIIVVCFVFPWLFLFLFLQSCERVDEDIVSKEIRAINEWIFEHMEALYFWNDKIPAGLNPGKEPDPEEFFYKMIYKEEDKWSYITPDLDALIAELEGRPLSSGISPAFVRIGESQQVLIIVEFVYQGSPADRAGIKRGDLILTINGEYLNIDNCYELFSQPTINIGKGIISGNSFIPTGESFSLVSEVIEADPLIYHDVMDINGIKTGYIVYSSFTAGANDKYISTMDNIIQEFKNEGISELIVDLRYNTGGEIDVAAYLASAIVPYSVMSNNETLVQYIYNDYLTDYLKGPGIDPEYLGLNFPVNTNNLNLDKVYFLTGWKTASASELIIIGLKPYMDVKKVGESTYGKYTGSWVITDTNNPPKHKWAMMPIILKYANLDGYTDFKNGLSPDYPVMDFIFDLKPLGDPGDPVLTKAKELIGGISVKAAPVERYDIPYRMLEDEDIRRKSRLVMRW
jgi:carboxyl-terminal processing protease